MSKLFVLFFVIATTVFYVTAIPQTMLMQSSNGFQSLASNNVANSQRRSKNLIINVSLKIKFKKNCLKLFQNGVVYENGVQRAASAEDYQQIRQMQDQTKQNIQNAISRALGNIQFNN